MSDQIETVKAHLDEAFRVLTGEIWREGKFGKMEKAEMFCTCVADLRRIDGAVGPVGTSIFSAIADDLEAAYIEICAARDVLRGV